MVRIFAGVDPNAPNYDAPAVSGDEMIAVFPLFIAAQNGHIDVVRWLISGESPLTRANKMNMHNESTALHFAGMNDHVEIMKLLLDDPNAPDINAGTGSNPTERINYLNLKSRDCSGCLSLSLNRYFIPMQRVRRSILPRFVDDWQRQNF